MKINEIISGADLSCKEKIIFLEEYYTNNGILTESNSEENVKQFNFLAEDNVIPIIGEKYIVMALMLVSDMVIPFQLPIVGKFIGVNGNDMIFVDVESDTQKTFPPPITNRVKSSTYTLIYNDDDKYNQTRLLLDLKYDLELRNLGHIYQGKNQ